MKWNGTTYLYVHWSAKFEWLNRCWYSLIQSYIFVKKCHHFVYWYVCYNITYEKDFRYVCTCWNSDSNLLRTLVKVTKNRYLLVTITYIRTLTITYIRILTLILNAHFIVHIVKQFNNSLQVHMLVILLITIIYV